MATNMDAAAAAASAAAAAGPPQGRPGRVFADVFLTATSLASSWN